MKKTLILIITAIMLDHPFVGMAYAKTWFGAGDSYGYVWIVTPNGELWATDDNVGRVWSKFNR